MSRERMPPDESSWMSRPLERLTYLVARFPVPTLLLAGAAVVVSLWLTMTQLGFRTSRAELLSPDSDYNRRWLEYTKEFSSKEDVVVVVEGVNREQIIPALDDTCRELAGQSKLFGAVMHETDAPKLRAKGLYYLSPEQLRQIDGFLAQAEPILHGDWSRLSLGGMTRWVGAAMNGGSDAQRQQVMAAMQTELPSAIQGLTAALGPSGSYRSPWPEMPVPEALAAEAASTRLISKDGRLGLILLRLLEEDKQSFAQNTESIRALRQLTTDVASRHPGVKIGLTGLPIIEHDEMRSSETSMSVASVLSFVGVLAVIVVAFGGLRHSMMAMAAMVVGTIWACGCVALTVGHVNVLSVAFGSILFGLGIDYGISYVVHYLNLRQRTNSTTEALVMTAGSVGPGILTTAVCSSIAFFAAGLTDFPGVTQLGVIAGAGIMLCWLAEAAVLPAMIRLTDADGRQRRLPLPLDLKFWLRPLFAFPRLTLVAAAVATALTAVGVRYLYYDYNLLNLQPTGLESVELEHKASQLAGRSAWFAISMAATPEEVARRKEAFLKLPSVDRVVEVATKIPQDANIKRPIIEHIRGQLMNLPSESPKIPVTPVAELNPMLAAAESMLAAQPEAAAGLRQLQAMLQNISPAEYNRRVSEYQQNMAADLLKRLQMLKSASSPEPPRVDDLPEGVRCRFVGRTGCYAMQVYSKANIWDVKPMEQFVHDVRSIDPEATGNPLQVYEASRQMKRSFEQAALYALLMILPVVLLDFRRLDHALLAIFPMSVGLLQTLGLMGLLDIPLNPANMIVLPLTLGIGIDCGIHIVHELRCHRGRYRGASSAVLVSIVVNALTTTVGFGALMVANHRGLQSLGRVLTISMTCCMICSLLLPNLLVAGRFSARDEDSTDDDEDFEPDDEWDENDVCDDDENEDDSLAA